MVRKKPLPKNPSQDRGGTAACGGNHGRKEGKYDDAGEGHGFSCEVLLCFCSFGSKWEEVGSSESSAWSSERRGK